jgi:hypothetical protein
MRFSILGDDSPTTLDASVIEENADKSVADPPKNMDELMTPDDITDSELPGTAEYLVIGPRQRSRWRRVFYAAGLAVLAAILTPWPITTSPHIQTEPMAPTSASVPPWAPAEPQQLIPLPGQAHVGSNAGSLYRPAAYAQFCHNSPALCRPTATATPVPTGYINSATTVPRYAQWRNRTKPNHTRSFVFPQ